MSHSGDDEDVPRAWKRKLRSSSNSPRRHRDFHHEHDCHADLHQLADQIADELSRAAPGDAIEYCGRAPRDIIATNPDDVLELALEKLNAYPFAQVPKNWLRLYEDASLYKVVKILQTQADATKTVAPGHGDADGPGHPDDVDWITQVISVLEKGQMLSGAPRRQELFEAVFQQLDDVIDDDTDKTIPATFTIERPHPLFTLQGISRSSTPLGIDRFQTWLDSSTEPLIIAGVMDEWPATHKWHDPRYLIHHTLGGRRLVPVEVGRTYTDEDWQQTVMTMKDFMTTYVLPENPEAIGYLAQHDLFKQFPALKNDIVTPDYCYTSPPPPSAAALHTMGLSQVMPLDDPLLNAWLGPKGTKTPLHTDPYHNILCQVVGYKYVRLYAPDQTPNVYPRTMDEKGINMANTSQVDVKHVRTRSLGGTTNVDCLREIASKYPRFTEASFQEAILGPGECLYVPLGWWHYVESLTTSFSVSFWWN